MVDFNWLVTFKRQLLFEWFDHDFEHLLQGLLMFVSQGLVVPVVRNVETMSCADLEKALFDLGEKVILSKHYWNNELNKDLNKLYRLRQIGHLHLHLK